MVTINDCPAQTPVLSSTNPSSCYGSAFTTISVTSHVKGDITQWYDANKKLIATGNSFTPSATTLANDKGPSFLYVADYLATEGCRSSMLPITYTVNFVDIPNILPYNPICEMDIAGKKITATTTVTGGSIQWSYNGQTITGNDFVLTTAGITGGQTDPYTISVIQQQNTCSSKPILVPVTISTRPLKPTVLSYFERCANDLFFDIPASNTTGTITWYSNASRSSVASTMTYLPASSLDKTVGMHYYYAVQSEGACASDTATAQYKVRQIPARPVISQSPSPFCVGSSATLNLSNAAADPQSEQLWLDDQNKAISLQSIIARAQTIGSFTIKLYQDDGQCISDTVSHTLYSYKTPSPIIEGKDSLCERTVGVMYTINTKTQNATSTYDWAVSGTIVAFPVDNEKRYRRSINWIRPGIDTIFVTETTAEGCAATTTKVIRVAANPVALFTEENTGQEGTVLFYNRSHQEPLIDGKDIPFSTIWNFGRPNDSFIKIANSTDTPISQAYEYGYWNVNIEIQNNFGCTASYEKEIFVDISTGLHLPNCFVPESRNPGTNLFKPVGFNLETYKISIFDTWGNLIWYSDKLIDGCPAESWDGTANGVVMKMDTYIWRIDATFRNNKEWKGNKRGTNKFSKFGNVLLLR
jgi:hypothetical protein